MAVPPGDQHLVEQRVSGGRVFSGELLKIERDIVRMPSGATSVREYIVHPGAVAVVALLDDGRVLLERQFRYPVGRVMLELPAGKLDAGEAPLACGQRELREETGYSAREWARAGQIHNAVGYADEVIHLYFARGLVAGPQRLDEGELLELMPVTEIEFDALAQRGEITDVKTLCGLQWLQRWRAGAWPLRWQAA
jgi:ADP-ribose pyrophosphatase